MACAGLSLRARWNWRAERDCSTATPLAPGRGAAAAVAPLDAHDHARALRRGPSCTSTNWPSETPGRTRAGCGSPLSFSTNTQARARASPALRPTPRRRAAAASGPRCPLPSRRLRHLAARAADAARLLPLAIAGPGAAAAPPAGAAPRPAPAGRRRACRRAVEALGTEAQRRRRDAQRVLALCARSRRPSPSCRASASASALSTLMIVL
mgnify:CR=1 FL=1